MHKSIISALACLWLVVPLSAVAGPEQGQPAPDFKLQDQTGEWHTLGDYRGKWLVLYFYPKDFTPGCTTEACAFRDDIFKFRKMQVELVGISLDDVQSHEKFAAEYSLPFPLLADDDGAVAREYGTYLGLGGGVGVARRQTFIITPDGTLARHYPKVDPEIHSAEVLTELESLIGAGAPDS